MARTTTGGVSGNVEAWGAQGLSCGVRRPTQNQLWVQRLPQGSPVCTGTHLELAMGTGAILGFSVSTGDPPRASCAYRSLPQGLLGPVMIWGLSQGQELPQRSAVGIADPP